MNATNTESDASIDFLNDLQARREDAELPPLKLAW